METNLRQANAKVFVCGMVSDKDLKAVTEDGMNKIKGSVTVKTSDVNFIKFNVNVNEKTNNNDINKVYAGIQTVMNEYNSIADCGEENATKVRVTGDINPFTSQNGESIITYRGNFFNRIKEDSKYEPNAEFSVEIFISDISPEMDSEGIETGRLTVTGWMPTFNGIEPISLVADSDIASSIESSFEVGQTVEFYGEVINNRIETRTEIPVKIGKPRYKVKVEYKNNLCITGASEAYAEGTTTEMPYNESTIEAAIQVRNDKIREARNKNNNQSATKPSGAARGRNLKW